MQKAEPKRWNKNRGVAYGPDYRHKSCRHLFAQTTRSRQDGTDPVLAKVRRMRYQVVRARDLVILAGFDEAPNARKKIARFLCALGDPEQRDYFVHRFA